jgi:hypothetical protein
LTFERKNTVLGLFEVVGSSQEESFEFYDRWNEEVKATVPPERLLVMIFFLHFLKKNYFKI